MGSVCEPDGKVTMFIVYLTLAPTLTLTLTLTLTR